MKKLRWTIVATVTLLVITIVSVIITFQMQRQDYDVFIKIVIWSSSPHGNAPLVNYLVIGNDGTFTSYFGTSRNHGDITRRNFMRSVQEQEVVILDAQDFQNITELANAVIAIENNPQLWPEAILSRTHVTLYYNGNIYGDSTARSGYFHELISTIVQLSPLSIHW